MAGKRARGSLRRLPSGNWQVRYTGPDGLRRSARQTYSTKADEDVPSSVELRWRPDDSQATFTISS